MYTHNLDFITGLMMPVDFYFHKTTDYFLVVGFCELFLNIILLSAWFSLSLSLGALETT